MKSQIVHVRATGAPVCDLLKNTVFVASNPVVEPSEIPTERQKAYACISSHSKQMTAQVMKHPCDLSPCFSKVMQASSYCTTMPLEFLCQLTEVTSEILFKQLKRVLVIHCNRLTSSCIVALVKFAVLNMRNQTFAVS